MMPFRDLGADRVTGPGGLGTAPWAGRGAGPGPYRVWEVALVTASISRSFSSFSRCSCSSWSLRISRMEALRGAGTAAQRAARLGAARAPGAASPAPDAASVFPGPRPPALSGGDSATRQRPRHTEEKTGAPAALRAWARAAPRGRPGPRGPTPSRTFASSRSNAERRPDRPAGSQRTLLLRSVWSLDWRVQQASGLTDRSCVSPRRLLPQALPEQPGSPRALWGPWVGVLSLGPHPEGKESGPGSKAAESGLRGSWESGRVALAPPPKARALTAAAPGAAPPPGPSPARRPPSAAGAGP